MPNLSGSLAISGSLILFDGTNTVNFTATGSSASFTSSFANTSGCTNKVNIYSTASGDTSMFVTLVPDLSTGCQYTYVDQQLRYDAVSNLLYTTAEYALNATTATSASYVLNAISSSFARTASIATSAITAQTASYVQTAQTASYAQNAQTASYVLNAVSSSYATTANNININSLNSSDTTVSLVMVPNQTTGSQSTIIDSKLYFNAADNVLTTDNLEVAANITSSGDLRFLVAGNAVVRPIIDLIPNGTASYNPNSTNTTAYANYGINVISTSSTSSNCFRLPQTPTKGKTVTLINKSGMEVFVFPSVVGGSINGVIDGYFSLPSDGKSYSLDCYENPLPGGWSISNAGSSTTTNILTNVITFNSTGSKKYLTFVNDSCKASGSNYITQMYWNSLSKPQYTAQNWPSPTSGYSVVSHVYSDSIPGQDIWQSVNSITIYTNLSGSYDINGLIKPFINNPTTVNYNTQFYAPGDIYGTDIYMQMGYQQGDASIDQSLNSFKTNTILPWYNSHPGTGFGANANSSYIQCSSAAQLYFGYNQSIVPGTCTPSQANPYVSDNPGDPGTVTFTIPNIPIANLGWYGTYSGQANPSLRMLGRNFIGTYTHPYQGNFDCYYSMDFGMIIRPYVYDSLGNDVDIPNLKIQAIYNVSY